MSETRLGRPLYEEWKNNSDLPIECLINTVLMYIGFRSCFFPSPFGYCEGMGTNINGWRSVRGYALGAVRHFFWEVRKNMSTSQSSPEEENNQYYVMIAVAGMIFMGVLYYAFTAGSFNDDSHTPPPTTPPPVASSLSWEPTDKVCHDAKREVADATTAADCQTAATEAGYTHIDFYSQGCRHCSQKDKQCYMSHSDSKQCKWANGDHVTSFNLK